MKIALIYLPHPYLKQPEAQMPLGILYLSSILKQKDIEVEVCNFTALHTNEAISKLPKADIYGITVTSFEIPQANRFAYLIKELYWNNKVILGGAGTIAQEFVDFNIIDSICIGDGEITILDMLHDYPNMNRVYYGKPVKNLNKLPFPDRGAISNIGGNIFAYGKEYIGKGSTVILSSRNCYFNCSFCTSPYLRKINNVRFRNSQNVYDEIKDVIDKYGIRQFRFSDDMFTSNKQHMYNICDKLSGLDIVWRISCRVKPFTKEMAQRLYETGCKEVSFGIESFDDTVLKTLNKQTTAKDNVKALEICEKVGIKARVLFMIRTPGQTKNTVPINIEYLKQVPYNIIACTSFVPIPRSNIYDNPDKYNIEILNKNLDDYNFYFFSSNGENKLKNIIKIKDRSLDEFNKESQYFRDYLKSTNKLNMG